MSVLQRLGATLGTAILAVVLQRALAAAGRTPDALAGAFGTAFWWALGLSLLAAVPCLFLVRAERSSRGRSHTMPMRTSPARHRSPLQHQDVGRDDCSKTPVAGGDDARRPCHTVVSSRARGAAPPLPSIRYRGAEP